MQRLNSDEILDFDISEHPDRLFLEEMAALTGRRKIIIIEDEDEEDEPNDLVRVIRRNSASISVPPAPGVQDALVSHARGSGDND